MNSTSSPMQYLESRISELPESANVILLLDPQKMLMLDKKHIFADGRIWTVLNYNGNDLAFRREYATTQPPLIVWITPEEGADSIDLTFIPDVINRADSIIDVSIFALLKELAPSEAWPTVITEYSDIIYKNFETFITKYKELRKEIDKKAPLTKDHILALVLSCQNPEISVSDLISWGQNIDEIIARYLKIVWSHDLEDYEILKDLVRDHASQGIEEWLEKDPKSLAIYFYLEDLFQRYSVPNPKNQIRGIGVIPFDPEELKGGDAVLARIRNELQNEVYRIVEEKLGLKAMVKAIRCIPFSKPEEKWNALLNEKNSVFVSAMTLEILDDIIDGKIDNIAPEKISSTSLYHDEKTKNGLELLYHIASIRSILDKSFEPKEDVAQLVKWYVDSRAYSMELSSARAYRALKLMHDKKRIYDEELRKKANNYIWDLKSKIHDYLEKADLNLADLLEKDWPGYLSNPKLSTHILKSAKRKLKPDDRLWVLLFDGMRFDTWEEVVKPIIQTRYEILEEGSYLCALPSVTEIARTALFAGATPDRWNTNNQLMLVQRLFGLSPQEGKGRLNFVTRSESDTAQRAIETKDYNILIYNLSDVWIHNSKSDIADLNDEIKQKLENNILPDLNRIGEKDKVIIASDHGFIELLEGDAIKMPYISEGADQEVRYRYLKNIELTGRERSAGLKIRYRQDEFYTVAKGRKWFDRAGGKSDRYSHGGISLAEMVVPGVQLKKIEKQIIALELGAPEFVSGREDDVLSVKVSVSNVGNVRSDFKLSFTSNTGKEKTEEGTLDPASMKEYVFEISATTDLKFVDYDLLYTDTNKKQVERKKRIRIEVERRKDKVELDLGALDLLGDEE